MLAVDKRSIIDNLKHKVADLADSPGLEGRLDDVGSLRQIGIDSILMINLLVYIEQTFDVSFSDEELQLDHFDTLGQIAEAIAGKRVVRSG